MKLSVIVPVLNEANTVRILLDRVAAQAVPVDHKEIVIVESGSRDGSRALVEQFVQDMNGRLPNLSVRLLLQPSPLGKGHAVQAGLKAASGDIILIQDADLEYDTADYPALLEPILSGRTSFVLGSRHLANGCWKIRRFERNYVKAWVMNCGGVLFHTFFNMVYGQRLTDPTTMYKVFKRSALRGLNFEARRFDFDYELVAKLIRSGAVPMEVPVSYVSRSFEQGKKINVWRDPLTWVHAIIKYRFAPLNSSETAQDLSEDLPRPAAGELP